MFLRRCQPEYLKIPIPTEFEKNSKGKYRPVNILSNISKIYDVSVIKFGTLFILYCPNINTSFLEATVRNTA